jgi:hypothetical protein
MSFQRVEYPSGVVSSGLKLKYTRMTRTIFDAAKPSILLDESMTPLVLPPGATIERLRVLPPMPAERLPYPTTIAGNPFIEIKRVSTNGLIVKQIRTYATDEIGAVDSAPFSQGLITTGLAVDVKKMETGVCLNVLVGSKKNPTGAAGDVEGANPAINDATLRPLGSAMLQQYGDESAFDAVQSNLSCTFTGVAGSIYDVTIVVEYTIGRASFSELDAGGWLAA